MAPAEATSNIGLIIGIVVGVVAAIVIVVIIIIIVVCYCRRRSKQQKYQM